MSTDCVKPSTHWVILYADRRERRKSPGVPGAAIAIFADRRDRRIKSPICGISHEFSILPHRRDRRKKSPSVSASIGGENRLRFSLPIIADTLGDVFSPIARMWQFQKVIVIKLRNLMG